MVMAFWRLAPLCQTHRSKGKPTSMQSFQPQDSGCCDSWLVSCFFGTAHKSRLQFRLRRLPYPGLSYTSPDRSN